MQINKYFYIIFKTINVVYEKSGYEIQFLLVKTYKLT